MRDPRARRARASDASVIKESRYLTWAKALPAAEYNVAGSGARAVPKKVNGHRNKAKG